MKRVPLRQKKMINNQPYSPLNHRLAIILSLSFGALFAFVLFAGFTFGGKQHHHQISFGTDETDVFVLVLIRFTTGVLTFYSLYEFCFWIFRKNWKNRKKYLLAFFGTIAAAMLISPFISIAALQFCQLFRPLPDNLLYFLIRVNISASVIVFLSTLFISAFVRSQQTLVENQRLVAENIRNRYEALKNQLNPHFLFNTLNTLDGLIDLDKEKAHEFLQNLSSSFRYTIQNKEITTLKEELDFTDAYTYLMKIRYDDDLNIRYAVDEKYNSFYIMPLTLQLLIENAIKHNVINEKRPLTIFIETTENETIKITNTFQPKIKAEAGEGVGLANLIERYNLLFGMNVSITKNDVWEVEIPLIEQINDNK